MRDPRKVGSPRIRPITGPVVPGLKRANIPRVGRAGGGDHQVQSRTKAWGAALAVTLLAIVLPVLDLGDRSVDPRWERHAFTTSIVSGVLVLLVTVLVVNRLLSVRQLRDRSRAIAAQAAIVMSQ